VDDQQSGTLSAGSQLLSILVLLRFAWSQWFFSTTEKAVFRKS